MTIWIPLVARADGPPDARSFSVEGYCSILFEQSVEVTKTFLVGRHVSTSESTKLGADVHLSTEGPRSQQMPTMFAPEDVGYRFDLEPVEGSDSRWTLRVFPIFAPEPNKYYGRELPPDPLTSGPIQGQSEAVVEISLGGDGRLEAVTQIDGTAVRASASEPLVLRLPFVVEKMRSRADASRFDSQFMIRLAAILDRLARILRRPRPMRRESTEFTFDAKLEFFTPAKLPARE